MSVPHVVCSKTGEDARAVDAEARGFSPLLNWSGHWELCGAIVILLGEFVPWEDRATQA
jgi:hypothetical protein